jgi:hypothetical protein
MSACTACATASKPKKRSIPDLLHQHLEAGLGLQARERGMRAAAALAACS